MHCSVVISSLTYADCFPKKVSGHKLQGSSEMWHKSKNVRARTNKMLSHTYKELQNGARLKI